MKTPIKLNAIETDAFSRKARKFLRWKAGTRKWIKKKFNRKLRRFFKHVKDT